MSYVDVIELAENKTIGVRMVKMLNGQFAGLHRTTIVPGGDPDFILAAVNADLKTNLAVDVIADSGWEPVRSMVKIAHTPDVIAAYEKKTADAIAAKQPGGN